MRRDVWVRKERSRRSEEEEEVAQQRGKSC
jgi:hypothetical protein